MAAKAGSNEPAVGDALTYPVGVVLTIVVSIVLNRGVAGSKDPASTSGQAIVDVPVVVERPDS